MFHATNFKNNFGVEEKNLVLVIKQSVCSGLRCVPMLSAPGSPRTGTVTCTLQTETWRQQIGSSGRNRDPFKKVH